MSKLLDVAPLWRMRFDLIEKAGGPKWSNIKQLKIGERFRISWNFWALFFGPFYYLAKGMWRKALFISLWGFALITLIGIIAPHGELDLIQKSISTSMTVWCTLNANFDYYRKLVLKDNGWW